MSFYTFLAFLNCICFSHAGKAKGIFGRDNVTKAVVAVCYITYVTLHSLPKFPHLCPVSLNTSVFTLEADW